MRTVQRSAGAGLRRKKGVYGLHWDEDASKLLLRWHRDDINLNNVLQYSVADDLLYGSGRERDCKYYFYYYYYYYYYYYGLDWATGATTVRFALGTEPYLDDPGNANIVLEDGSIVFNSQERLVRVAPQDAVSGLAERPDDSKFTISPNPASDRVELRWDARRGDRYVRVGVFDSAGRTVIEELVRWAFGQHTIDVSRLTKGNYVVELQGRARRASRSLLVG